MSEFRSIREVHSEFFNLFLAHTQPAGTPAQPYLPIGPNGTLVRYARRSGGNDGEDLPVVYPCVSLETLEVEVDRKRSNLLPYAEEGDITFNAATQEWEGKLLPLAVPFTVVYQVTVTTARESELTAFEDWLYGHFDLDHPEPCFLMKQVQTAEGLLGTTVLYQMETAYLPREDKFFEVAYTFTLKPYVYLKTAQETFTVVESTSISPIPKELGG